MHFRYRFRRTAPRESGPGTSPRSHKIRQAVRLVSQRASHSSRQLSGTARLMARRSAREVREERTVAIMTPRAAGLNRAQTRVLEVGVEPADHAEKDVTLISGLGETVPLIGVDDQLRFHVQRLEG